MSQLKSEGETGAQCLARLTRELEALRAGAVAAQEKTDGVKALIRQRNESEILRTETYPALDREKDSRALMEAEVWGRTVAAKIAEIEALLPSVEERAWREQLAEAEEELQAFNHEAVAAEAAFVAAWNTMLDKLDSLDALKTRALETGGKWLAAFRALTPGMGHLSGGGYNTACPPDCRFAVRDDAVTSFDRELAATPRSKWRRFTPGEFLTPEWKLATADVGEQEGEGMDTQQNDKERC